MNIAKGDDIAFPINSLAYCKTKSYEIYTGILDTVILLFIRAVGLLILPDQRDGIGYALLFY